MKEKLFIGILNMSLTACIIIPVVIALRFLLRKAPKFFSYILWAVVLFRLICPVSFSAAFSLLGALDAPKTERGQISYISVDIAEIPADTKDMPFPVASPVQGGAALEKKPAAKPMVSAVTIGSWIWLAGILALLIYSVVTLVKLKRKLKNAGHERDNIYIVENLTTPFACGFFAPKIYLPAALEGEEKAYILLHEQIHIKRGDHIVKILGYLALCVHWFNPLVWAAFFLSGRDMEMSCDEAVIRKMGIGVKKEYSASLLNLATGRRIIGGVTLAFGEGDTGGRIKNVLGYKKPAAVLICAVTVIIAAAAAVLLANPQKIEAAGSVEEEQTLGMNAEGSYEVVILGLSEGEPRAITSYVLVGDYESRVFNVEEGDEPLVFSDDCVYLVNRTMETLHFEVVSYEKFVNTLVKLEDGFQWNPVQITLRDNLIVEAAQKNAYMQYGISFCTECFSHQHHHVLDAAGEDMLEQYYTLVGTEPFDVADSDGDEQIEIYTGNTGDGNSGLVLFRNAEGSSLFWSEFAPQERVDWSVYLGEIDGMDFIMGLRIEDRGDSGKYSYCVYRLSADGVLWLIAGSSFEWEPGLEYRDVFFQAWMSRLTYYLEHSRRILSSQGGELRTEQVSEADVYNYETLNLKGRKIG